MARFKSVRELKKENYLLVFMMNRMNSEGRLFCTYEDDLDFIAFGGTANLKSLYTMLQVLKKKGYVKNRSRGVWDLTDFGLLEANYWYKECKCRDDAANSTADEQQSHSSREDEDNVKPEVEVKLAEDAMTASVVVTFPFMDQALAFGEVCRTLLAKMPAIAKHA